MCSRSAPGFASTGQTTRSLSARKQCPSRAPSSGFKFGRATGALEAAIACCEIPMTIIEPTRWKKLHQLRGGEKEASRQRALQLFPAAHALFARRMDHGRAEAALIALAADTAMKIPAEQEIRVGR
jgi:crossover junction endodeoxyribonuclease RuvC